MGRNDSDELLLNKKYSRKTKFIKKKSQEMGSVPSRKKKCPQFDKGMCPNGALCSYSHSFIPDIAKVDVFIFRNNVKIMASTCAKKGSFALFLTISQDSLANNSLFSETVAEVGHANFLTKKSILIFIKIFSKIISILFWTLSKKENSLLRYPTP